MTQSIPNINLVPQRVIQRRARSRVTLRWVCAIVATVAFVGLPGVYLGGNAALSDSMMSGQIERVRDQLGTNKAEIPRLQARIGVLEEKRQTLDLVRNRINWQTLFGHMVRVSDEQIHFTALRAIGGGVEGTDPLRVQMDGIATSQTAARSFVVELERLGIFDQVELVRTMRQTLDDQEVIEFQVMAIIGEDTEATE